MDSETKGVLGSIGLIGVVLVVIVALNILTYWSPSYIAEMEGKHSETKQNLKSCLSENRTLQDALAIKFSD